MKIGDRVTTSLGPGVYVGGANGFLRVRIDATGRVRRLHPIEVSEPSPISTQVDAVVGEQCAAILERLRDALGVGSIGEVEAAVMGIHARVHGSTDIINEWPEAALPGLWNYHGPPGYDDPAVCGPFLGRFHPRPDGGWPVFLEDGHAPEDTDRSDWSQRHESLMGEWFERVKEPE